MSALVILAPDAEDIEVVTVVDVLRRGKISVTIGGLVGANVVKCCNGVNIVPDTPLSDVSSKLFDAIILPGGVGGSEALCSSPIVGTMLKKHYDNGKIVAAICAAPTALSTHKIGVGKRVTCYPGFQNNLRGYTYCEDRVVVDGKLVTSRGPGTAMAFALKLLELLEKKSGTSKTVAQGMLCTS